MERLGCWQLLGPHHVSRASTHFTLSFPPLSPSLPLSLSPTLSLRPFFLAPQDCYAKLSKQGCGSSLERRCIQIIFVQSPVVARDVGPVWELLLSGLSSQVWSFGLTWDMCLTLKHKDSLSGIKQSFQLFAANNGWQLLILHISSEKVTLAFKSGTIFQFIRVAIDNMHNCKKSTKESITHVSMTVSEDFAWKLVMRIKLRLQRQRTKIHYCHPVLKNKYCTES